MEPLSVDALVTAARWLRATNSAGETVPAHALVKPVGSDAADVYEADKPDADGQFVFVWGIQETPDGFVGAMTNDFPAYALYDAADGVPAVGETWGAGSGTFKLKKGKAGFRVVGDPDTTLGIVPVTRSPARAGFFARLTDSGTNATTSTTGWDFIRVAYTDDSGWGWHDDSAETTGYPAFPLPVDGTSYAVAPVAGLRVWVIRSANTPDLYEFFPLSVGYFIRLTSSGTNATTSTTGWNFYRQAYFNDAGWGWHDVGSEVTGYTAFPLTTSSSYQPTPVAGQKVWAIPSAKVGGLLEFLPADTSRTGFFARLTTASGGKWKWVALTLNTSGAETDDGAESSAYNATPLAVDGTNLCNPVAGLRVWMMLSKTADGSGNPQYEFLPIGYASEDYPGLVSITTQQFSGEKEFLDGATTPEYFEADGTNGFATLYADFASLNLPATTAPLVVPYVPYEPTAPDDPISVVALQIPTTGPVAADGGVIFGKGVDAEGAGGGGEIWVVPTPNGSDQAGLMVLAGRYCAYSNGYVYVGVDGPDTVLTPGGTAFTTVKTRSGIVYDGDATPFLKDVQICATRNLDGAITALEIQKTFWNGDTETVVCVNDTTGCCDSTSGSGGSGGPIPPGTCAPTVTDFGDGATSGFGTVSLTFSGVTVPENSVLMVAVAVYCSSPATISDVTATFAGTDITSQTGPEAIYPTWNPNGYMNVFLRLVGGSTTGDVVITATGGVGGKVLLATVTTAGVSDSEAVDGGVQTYDSGESSNPDSGTGDPSTPECLLGFGMIFTEDSGDGTWNDDFVGLQSVSWGNYRLQTGYRAATASGETFTASMSDITPSGWTAFVTGIYQGSP